MIVACQIVVDVKLAAFLVCKNDFRHVHLRRELDKNKHVHLRREVVYVPKKKTKKKREKWKKVEEETVDFQSYRMDIVVEKASKKKKISNLKEENNATITRAN